MKTSYREKIISLWIVFLLGTLFHTQLGLMPLFHNQSIVTTDAHEVGDIAWILWLMLGFFSIPLIATTATLFDGSKRYRRLHFGITIFYSAMNLLHITADLFVKPVAWYQIVLMIELFMVGLLLNLASYQWLREQNDNQLLREHKMTL